MAAQILAHLSALRKEEIKAAAGEPDAVHRMRVSSRRLREALRLLSPPAGIEKAARRVTRALGDLREEQVTAAIYQSLRLTAVGAELRGLDELLGVSQRRVERERRRTCSCLGRADLAGLVLSVSRLIHGAGRAPVAPLVLDELLPLGRNCDRRRLALDRGRSERRLHNLRTAVKRMRYAVELVAAGGPAGERFRKSLELLQDALGRHHDLSLACELAERRRARLASERHVALAAAVEAALRRMRRAERKAADRVERALRHWPPGSFIRRAGRVAMPDRSRAAIVVGTRTLAG